MFEIIATIRRDQEKRSDIQAYSDRIKFLILELGITTFRINVGKWNTSEFEILVKDVEQIRRIANENCKEVTIILDLPFPGKKARVITYVKKIEHNIKEGKPVEIFSASEEELGKLISTEQSKKYVFGISVPNIGDRVKIGDEIIYADGEGMFEVSGIDGSRHITAIPKSTFKLDHSKSIHFSQSIQMSKIDESVKKLIKEISPDVIALSFVENSDSVNEVKQILDSCDLKCQIMAKIENAIGVENFEKIIESVDSIMVARGDLGLYIDIKDFPKTVFSLINKTKEKNKLVYVATGFMDTYVSQCVPSRSDMIDLYTTVNSEADGIVFTYKTVRNNNIMKNIVEMVNDWIK